MKDKWEKELWEIFKYDSENFDHKKLIDFIRSLLTSQKEEMVEMIKGMKIRTDGDKDAPEIDQDWIRGKQHGYNQALSDIIKKIGEV